MSTVPIPHQNDHGGDGGEEYTYEPQGRFSAYDYDNTRGPSITDTGRRMTGVPIAPFSPPLGGGGSGSDAASKNNVRVIGVPMTFQWSGPQKEKLAAGEKPAAPNVTQHTPLPKALISNGLSPDENINLAEVRVLKATNASKQKVGVQFLNVNGEDLNHFVTADGTKVALVLHPGESVDYSHHDGGKGKLLASNPLDPVDQINVNMAPSEMMKAARAHPDKPGMVVTELDLSGYLDSRDETEQLKKLSPLGLLVLANAKGEIKSSRVVDPAIRAKLPMPSPDEETPILPGMELAPTPFKHGSYDALIDKQHLEELVRNYTNGNAAKAQPTSAKDHLIRVVPLDGRGPGAHIGDLSGAIGLSQREIDLAHATRQGVHLDVAYTIQHNGKKYDVTNGK